MIIGIDLGTTFSVLAAAGQVTLKPGYPAPRYLDQFDVSIIPDPFGNYTIPSAVWQDPDQPDELVVGLQAKQMVDLGQDPIQFSKRNIGTDIIHRSGGREYSAREVARILLEYLKGVAEDALDQRVDKAVITHPAYFDPAMKEETGLAAQDAGFDFDREEHLLMEPVAAALAYTSSDDRDPLRVLTYDLGGGTFDVTVMERRRGVISMKAFGGNRLLGGFNFDRELALWLYERMRKRGVGLTIRDDEPADQAKWQRLLQLAEDTKLKLAKARTGRVPVLIKEQAIFTDDDGMNINLIDQITRDEFLDLIRELLEETITGAGSEAATKGCDATLAEAGLTIDQVDEILLVGGSSGAPWVEEIIQQLWQRDAQVFEPDLCVAAGAAIHARSLPEEVQGELCRVELDVPRQSPLDSVNVAGRVTPRSDGVRPAELLVILASGLGRKQQASPDEEGKFFFADAELTPGAKTGFTLTVADGEGRALATHEFEVEQQDAAALSDVTSVLTVLPKPLYIETVTGMTPLAAEGVALPAHCEVSLVRANDDDSIEIRLFQESEPIGTTVIRQVPREASVGSVVKLSVDVSRNNRITGRAVVYTRRGGMAGEAPVDIRIPPLAIPELGILRSSFDELRAVLAERLELERNAETRLQLHAKGDKICQRVERSLHGPAPDRQEVWLALREFRRLVTADNDDMEPSLQSFEEALLAVKDILAEAPGDAQMQGHAKIVERLEKEGRATYARRDRKRWAQVCTGLDDLRRRLHARERSGGGDIPPTGVLKSYAKAQIDQTRQMLLDRERNLQGSSQAERVRPRIERIEKELLAAEGVVDDIDDATDPQQALARIRLLELQKLRVIESQVQNLGGPDVSSAG